MHDHAIEQISHTIINNIATISSEWMNSLRQRVIYVIRQDARANPPSVTHTMMILFLNSVILLGAKAILLIQYLNRNSWVATTKQRRSNHEIALKEKKIFIN